MWIHCEWWNINKITNYEIYLTVSLNSCLHQHTHYPPLSSQWLCTRVIFPPGFTEGGLETFRDATQHARCTAQPPTAQNDPPPWQQRRGFREDHLLPHLICCKHSRSHTRYADQMEVTLLQFVIRNGIFQSVKLLNCLRTITCNFQNVQIHRNNSQSVHQP